MLEDDVIELQTRIAFQEDTLSELNQVIARQDRQISELQRGLKALTKKFDDSQYEREQADFAPADERPPHY